MKILILSDDFPPKNFGGAGESTFDLSKGLMEAGNEVFVITICDKKEEVFEDYLGLKVFRIYAGYHDRWRAYLSIYNPQTVGKVRRIIREVGPDIVHAHNIHQFLSYHCLKIARKEGCRVFFTARDAMTFSQGKLATKKYLTNNDCRVSWLDNLKLARKRYNPLRNILIRKYLKYADGIFAVSLALKNALKQNGINGVIVSRTGVDVKNWEIVKEKVDAFKEKHGLNNKKAVFFGGRISGQKGYGQAQKALEIVKKEIPDAVLLVAGSKGLGWLRDDDLRAAYHASDLVIVPSLCFDAFPRSNIEAMACAKPVVTTCFGGSPEIVQDGKTGYIVDPRDTDLLAKRIIDLLKNPEKARQFGEAGYQRVKEEFSLEKQVNQTLQWYQRILENN